MLQNDGGLKTDRELGRSVIAIGNSTGVTIPSAWADKLEVEKGDSADLEFDADERQVRLNF